MAKQFKPVFQMSLEVIKDMPVEEIAKWEDKVVCGIARATLDITNTAHHFPYRTGALNEASMSEGVVKVDNLTYGLGAKGINYAPKVWGYGRGTNWTNKKTLPQWYKSVYNRYRDSILTYALRNAQGELK